MKTDTQPAQRNLCHIPDCKQEPCYDDAAHHMQLPYQVANRKKLLDLIERFSNLDCFEPWGVYCERTVGGEEWCESCEARKIMTEERL